MKHWLRLFLLAALALQAAGSDLFHEWTGNLPRGWEINHAYKETTPEKQQLDGMTVLAVRTGKQPFAMMMPSENAGPGTRFRFTVRFRGRGRFVAGLYCYNARDVWVGKNLDTYSLMLDQPAWTTREIVWTVPADDYPQRGRIARIRPMLTVAPGSDFQFAGCTVERENPTVPHTATTAPTATMPTAIPARPQGTPLYATVGSECNLYFANLDWPGAVRYQVEAPCGRLEDDRWTDVPRQSGTFPLVIRGLDAAGKTVREERFQLNIAPEKTKPCDLSILFVGDSLTDASVYPGKVMARLAAAGVNGQSIGSHCGSGKAPDGQATPHEGRGGWTFGSYLTRWTDGDDYRARSPFLAAPNQLDIPGYFARYHQGNPPDVIVFFLGCNDIASLTEATRQSGVAQALANAESLIGAFREAAPQARIGLALLPPPAPKQEAFGRNYGMRIQRDTYLDNRRALLAGLQDRFGNRADVSLIPIHLALDCIHHYPQEEEPAAAGSSVIVRRYVNAVHPSADGYRQLGDAIADWILVGLASTVNPDKHKQ